MWQKKVIAFGRRKNVQRSSIVFTALLSVFLLIQTFGKAYREFGNDFNHYYLSASELVLNGQDPYRLESPPFLVYPYPVFFPFVLIPFLFLPFWLACTIWYVLNLGSFFGSLLIFAKLFSRFFSLRVEKEILPFLTAFFILFLHVTQNTLLNGQVNFILLLFCVLFLKFYSEGREFLSSLVLSVAAAVKIFPIIFLFFLVARRKWRMIFLVFLSILLLSLLPIVTLGTHLFETQKIYVSEFLLSPIPSTIGGMGSDFTLHGFLGMFSPELAERTSAEIGCALLVMALVFFMDWFVVRNKIHGADVWLFSLYLLTMLLIAPISETHHLVFMYPAVFLAVVHSLYSVYPVSYARLTLWIGFWLSYYTGVFLKAGVFIFLSVVIMMFIVSGKMFLCGDSQLENPDS